MERTIKIHVPTFEQARDLSHQEGIRYVFMTEHGRFDLTYEEYLRNTELRDFVNNPLRYRLCVGRIIFTFNPEWLREKPDVRQQLSMLAREQEDNPLRFFAPSGSEALDFLNNTEDDILIFTAPNRFGKTQTGMIKLMINTMPCDPSWEIFSLYGVKHIPFLGPKKAGLASYELSSHQATILPMVLDWAPKSELGPYAKNYKGKGAKKVTLRVDPRIEMACGTEYKFFACSQGQAPFESDVREFWLWDEQGEEEKFDGADERSRTTQTGGRHYMPMTPHKLEGRPDTGGGSWISKLWNANRSKGRSIAKFKGDVWDVPDWIYPEKSKEKAYEKWVIEPAKDQNDKVRREGLSRFFGEWHESSGLVIDEWDSSKHIINPFDIPKNWTRYRAVDHGSSSHPTACLWAAVSPTGDLFIYQEYLRVGNVISRSCRDIIELSGNTRREIGRYENHQTGLILNRYEEVNVSHKYQWTIFDGKAYSQTDAGNTGLKLSDIYKYSGLNVKQGAGQVCEIYVPILKEWFSTDNNKRHFETGELGAPRVYVFSSCSNFIKQIKGWVWEPRKSDPKKMSPRKKEDDLMDCMKILIQAGPTFRGQVTDRDVNMFGLDGELEEDEFIVDAPINRITNY